MTIGNDGFTDCAFVCNPDNFMAWSCKEYCPEYEFVATTLRTLTTQSLGNNNTNESKNAQISVVLLSCIATLLLTIIVIVCCFNKRRLWAFVNKCRNKPLQPSPTVVQTPATDEEAESNLSRAGEDERALLRIENENNSNTNNHKSSHGRPFSITKTVINLPHASDLNNRSVQTLTHAVKPHENQLQLTMADANHVSQHETELKEVGELAGIAIGQSSSSFASNIVPIEPTTTETVVTADIESYESGENANSDDRYAETGTDGSKQINVLAGSDRNDSADNDLSRNEEEDDDDDADDDDDDNDDDDHDDDDVDDDDDDDDDDNDELEEEDMMLIDRRDHTNVVITNDNGFTNKTENTLPTDIVSFNTESNFREL